MTVPVAGGAHAQYLSEGTSATVMNRSRPELDPLGLRAGSFLVYPSLQLEETFDDNIFKTDNATVDDTISSVKPALQAVSQWSRHALSLSAGADAAFFADNDDEDYTDYNFFGTGRVDVRRDTNLTVSGGYNALHEDRGSPDDANGVEPTEYTLATANVAFSHHFNRVSLKPSFTFTQYDYDDVRTSGGTVVNNDDRDRDRIDVGGRIGYMIVPNKYEAFAQFTYNDRNYDLTLDDNGVNRDSDGYEVLVGTALDLGGVTFGDIYVGYAEQEYSDAALEKVDGLIVGGSIFWNPTQLTTINPYISRTIEETTLAGASGYFATTAGIKVDHELRRNFLLHGGIRFSTWKYEGNGRTDDYTNFIIGGDYTLRRYVVVGLTYELDNRDSSVALQDYSQNRVMVRVRGQL